MGLKGEKKNNQKPYFVLAICRKSRTKFTLLLFTLFYNTSNVKITSHLICKFKKIHSNVDLETCNFNDVALS